MGIKYNYEIFTGCGKEVSLRDLRDKCLAIDMMTYVVRYYKMFGDNKWYAKVIDFIRKLQANNITCLCVFDGYNKPPEKKICVQKRREISDQYKKEMRNVEVSLEEIKSVSLRCANGVPDELQKKQFDILNYKMKRAKMNCSYPTRHELATIRILLEELLGCKTFIADGEAESLCCWFVKNNQADHVLSEDSDVLLYDIDSFITKYTNESGKAKMYITEEILMKHGITFEELFYLCLMMGTDYNTGLDGFGFKMSLKKIKQDGIESIQKTLEEYEKNGRTNTSCERIKTLFTPNGGFQRPIYSTFEKQAAFNVLC